MTPTIRVSLRSRIWGKVIKVKNKLGFLANLYIIDGVCVIPSKNSEDMPQGPLWGS